MKKSIQLILFVIINLNIALYAQDINDNKINPNSTINGFYQKVDLNSDTPCSCDQKTQRTYDLAKGLRPYEVLNYSLHAYSFTFNENTNAASKLFKAFENDFTIYKISMKEWTSFMLLTTSDFDKTSFEKAAKQAFATFQPMSSEEFLKLKSTSSYNEYVNALEESKLQQQSLQNK